MSINQFGVPLDIATFLRDKLDLGVFVEGGTFKGNTAIAASELFERVITVENSAEMHAIASENLRGCENVTLLRGDTRSHLPSILAEHDGFLFWLDAHWSGGVTYGEGDECPLLSELDMIFSSGKRHAILIDDARLFLGPPPAPHRIEQWPSMNEVHRAIPEGWVWFCMDDVIHVVPEFIRKEFQRFLQTLTTERWAKGPQTDSLFRKALNRIVGK
jgi:hypothetical protein